MSSISPLVLALIIAVLLMSVGGFIVGALWSLPGAVSAYRYWRRAGPKARRIYSFWRLARTSIGMLCLTSFIGIAVLPLIFIDPENVVRQALARSLFLVVVAGITALVISEPVSERQIDRALEQEGVTLNGTNDGDDTA